MKAVTSFSKRSCSPFSLLKLSTASMILLWPPFTRQTAASRSITVITVLCVRVCVCVCVCVCVSEVGLIEEGIDVWASSV